PRSSSKDLRRQIVSSSSFKSNDIPPSSSGGSLSSSLPICDVVDPVDIEECVAQGKTRSYESSAYSNWTVRQFADFPSDDVELKIIEREILYKDPPYPCDIAKYEHFSTGEIFRCKTAENMSIVQNLPKQVFEIDLDDYYHDISRKDSVLSIQSDEFSRNLETAVPSKECLLDFNQSSADPVISGIIDRISVSQMDSANALKREKNRQSQLFNVYPLQHEDDIIEKRQRPALPCEYKGHRLFLKINSLRLDLEIEPIFASVALYDAKEYKKVSENFYFDCNSDALKSMLKSHSSHQEIISLSRSAIFNVTHPSNDLFLVFKLEKVLQAGELSEAADAYLREDKNKEKLKINCMEFCDRLGAYRMPFAWAAIDLSKIILGATNFVDPSIDQKSNPQGQCTLEASDTESIYSTDTFDRRSQNSTTVGNGTMKRSMIAGAGESSTFLRNSAVRQSLGSITSKGTTKCAEFSEIDKFKPLTLTVSNFFRQESDKLSDDDLYKYLNEIRKPASLAKKLKCIPGTLKFDISPYNEDLVENCVSPELLRLTPFREDDFNITKDVLEFPSKEIYAPNYGYRNLLYVYPKSVNFNSKPGSARNISVKVQLMQGASESLTAIFGKSSCRSKSDCYYTSVNYHNKAPQFHDEIKMQLPLDLNDTHHLLFTFYHISCKPKSALSTENQSMNLETPIGYAWLPLHSINELPSGEYNLPVALDSLPPCYFYLSPDTNFPNTKWLDNHKSVFNLVVTPVTTLYTQDKYLDAFSHIYHILRGHESHSGTIKQEKLTENDLQKAIKDLTKARPEPLVKFLYIILDRLIDLIILPPEYKGTTFNVEQTCFEMLGQIAKICTFLVDGFCDQHNRSSLLTTYVQYSKIGCYDSDVSPVRRNSFTSSTSHNAAYQTENSDLLEIIRGFERSSLLKCGPDPSSYSNFVHQPRKILHEELIVQWLESKGAAREMAYCNAWFFFELIIKSMGEYLLVPKPNRIYLKRKLRFSQHFVQDLTSLVSHLTTEIIYRYAKDQRVARNLNCSLAFFVRDALTLMDRTFIFGLIRSYCKQILAKVTTTLDSDYLFLLKLEFLRIICSHEHYLSLNLPFATGSLPLAQFQAVGQQSAPPQQPPSPSPSLSSRSSNGSANVSSTNGSLGGCGGRCLSSSAGGSSSTSGGLGAAELSGEYRSRHFLAGLVLADLTNALETKNGLIQNKAINILRNLLFAHDNDARLGDKFVKARIALMYFPLLGIVMESNGQLFDPYWQNARDSVSCGSANGLEEDGNINLNHASGSHDVPALTVNDICLPGIVSKRSTLSLDDTRNLLLSFCWVLKNVDPAVLRSWLQELPFFRATQLLDVLQFCVSCFEYKRYNNELDADGRKFNRRRISLTELKSVILGVNAARLDILNRHQKSDNSGNTGVRWRKDQTFKHNIIDSSPYVHEDSPKVRSELPNDPIAEGNLCTEVNTIVLDVLEMIVRNVTSSTGAISPAEHRLNSNAPGVINLVMRLVLHMLECQQSVQLCQNLFATQRSLVCKFPDLLFEEDVDQCAHLCLLLLRHCAGRLQPIRAQAAASLYLLLRQSYESSGNFARAKMQITVSLSSLVGSAAGHPSSSATIKRASLHHVTPQYSEWFDENNLRRSLKRILSYAESDTLSASENSGVFSPLNSSSSNTAAPSNIGVGFCEQVKDLVFNLHMILSDTVKMKEFQNDFEMLIDLMYRIAKGYQNSPDLRWDFLAENELPTFR
uniref:C2 DOCK-type domain-containing protein n=1 Tax=Romanomermis culicivorax TaxID=13658 RepID=A0A915L4Y3_ROMCU